MTINREYVQWLVHEHQLVITNIAQLEANNPWRLWFMRRVVNEPEISVNLWRLNNNGEPAMASVCIGTTRHSIRGARRIKNNLGRVMAAIQQLHLCDISDT